MKLKLDEAGHVVVSEGRPVYVDETGKDIPVDITGIHKTIGKLNAEAKSHRERAEAAHEALKPFEGLDAAAARKALELAANLDSKSLVAAGEVEKIKGEATKAFQDQLRAIEEKYKPVVEERDALSAKLVNRTIGAAFSGSKFITDKLVSPPPMVQATFGNHFKVENDAIVGYDAHGSKIYSRARPGEVADFDEALELLIERFPYRDQILKGSGASGSGAGGSGGAGAGGKTMARAAFDNLTPAARSTFMRNGGKIAAE